MFISICLTIYAGTVGHYAHAVGRAAAEKRRKNRALGAGKLSPDAQQPDAQVA